MSYQPGHKEAPTVSLNPDKVREFCHDVLEINGELMSLGDTRESSILGNMSRELKAGFSEILSKIEEHTSDKTQGIAAIDIPCVYEDLTDDAIAGALISIALTSTIIQPSKDLENLTPFTMFSASYESNKALNEAGLLNISPTDILDFHSDGLIRGRALGVPRYIAIYNTFINYRKCGSFYWVPTCSIENLMEHVDRIGFGSDFSFDLTPTIYGETGSRIDTVVERRVQTAVFSEDEDGSIITFMNGKFVGKNGGNSEYASHLRAFQTAISNNPFKYAAAQKSRRLIILNNASGFHARDIFEEPILGHEETRNYLRSVSSDAVNTGYVM